MPPFDTTAFNDVATLLLQGDNSAVPANVRTAVGRSYYSQYGYMRLRIEAVMWGLFGTKSWHAQLWTVCQEMKDKKHVRRIGSGLKHLWQLRTDADYVMDREITVSDAEGAIDTAADIQEKIRNLSEDDLTAIGHNLQIFIDNVQAGTPRRKP